MIKINKNDSIIDIIIKIKNCKDKEIVLEFPFWHPILHNYTSLKILKTKADKKELVIVTNDKTSKRIWKKLWIKYNLVSKEENPETQYSAGEYFLYTMKNYFKEVKNFLTNKARENSFAKYQKIYSNWKIWFFAIFLLLSILLLVFIFYFAVNKTYIHITPEIEFRPKWRNFVFEKMWNDDLTLETNIIKLREIQKTSSISTKILTSWVDEKDNKKSTWKIKVFNLTDKEVYLIKNSRLSTKDWLDFLLDNEIKIPAAILDKDKKIVAWEIEATVTARTEDTDWKIIWARWNIKAWEKLTLPWLKEDSDKIFANSVSEFTWWETSTKRILSKNDLENAKKILRWKLEQAWLNEIRKELESENKTNNVKYEILWASWMIKYSDFQFSWIENLKEWDEIEEFEIFWTLKTTAYAFNKEVVMNKLRNIIKEWLLTNVESIFSIDESSFAIVNEIWREENPFRIKATAQVRVWYIQNFLSEKNNFVEKLKHQIAWLPIEEAEKILINTWKVSNVNIEVRPFFIKNISKIVDNIKFEIK